MAAGPLYHYGSYSTTTTDPNDSTKRNPGILIVIMTILPPCRRRHRLRQSQPPLSATVAAATLTSDAHILFHLYKQSSLTRFAQQQDARSWLQDAALFAWRPGSILGIARWSIAEFAALRPSPRDPSIQIMPTLRPKVCTYCLHWAIWIPRVS